MIETYLDLVTNHLSRDTMYLLEQGVITPHWPAMTIAPYEFGAFISVPPKDADMSHVPPDLHDAIRHAQNEGATVIRFDADGAEAAELSLYDW